MNPELKGYLDRVAARYAGLDWLDTDPLCIPHGYSSPADREIAAFLAAALAYGRVDGILRSTRDVLARMGAAPHRFVLGFEPGRDARRFDGWVHRFNRGVDLAALCLALRQVLEAHGSLGAHFAGLIQPGETTVGPALTRWCEQLVALDYRPLYPGGALPTDAGVRWFFSSPRHGSACKRLNLYLRWMVRTEAPDLGLWSGVGPQRLLLPVDTHLARICRNLGLTARATVGWAMVEEITARLRELDPADPVRYDWALCRLGILQACPSRRDPAVCHQCELLPVCLKGHERPRRSGPKGRKAETARAKAKAKAKPKGQRPIPSRRRDVER